MDGACPGCSGGRPTVGRNRALVFGWNTSPHNSDAPANPVWADVLSVQVTCIQRHHAMHSNVQQGFRCYYIKNLLSKKLAVKCLLFIINHKEPLLLKVLKSIQLKTPPARQSHFPKHVPNSLACCLGFVYFFEQFQQPNDQVCL